MINKDVSKVPFLVKMVILNLFQDLIICKLKILKQVQDD